MGNQISAIIGSVTGVVMVATGVGVLTWVLLSKKKQKRQLLDPNEKYALRVVDRSLITHDTMRLKLGLDSPDHVLGLPVGNHVYLSARINGEMVVRPYTPVSPADQKGYVDFVIKVYKANTHPDYPAGGKMSQYLMNIPITHYVDIRGPAGLLNYKGQGIFDIKPDNRSPPTKIKAKYVSMICGGSGITPMFQLLSAIVSNKNDETRLALLFANNTEKDIILYDELEAIRSKHPNQLRLWFTVSTAPENWRYSVGYLTEQMIAEHIFPPGDDSLVLLCGPVPMLEFACYPILAKLNYQRERIFTY